MQAPWRSALGENRGSSPYWLDPADIPLLQIPGMNQESILPDSCHCFHLGWGIDLAASGLVLLAKRGCFGNGTLNDRLQAKYKTYTRWCSTEKRTTGISWWSTKKLDMASHLSYNQRATFC